MQPQRLAGVPAASVGVAYGRDGDDLPSVRQVVNLLQTNNVRKVRIYDTNAEVLAAFQDSDIALIVGVQNEQLSSLATGATQWVQENVLPYASIIKCVVVGNEVLTINKQYSEHLFPAITNVYNALSAFNLQASIQVSTSHATDVLDASSYPPSQGKFQSAIQDQMSSILQFLSQTGSPFLANVYPFFSYLYSNGQIPLSYALFEPGNNNTDTNGLQYTNLFDAQVDTLIAAMTALGHADITVVVTECGWPSNGDASATVDNAKTHNNNLVKHVSAGTPKRPDMLIETYIFALFNENLKPGPEYERHFGLFKADQTKLYDITL